MLPPPSSFPSSSLLLLLDHNCHSTRSKWRALASNPLFTPRYDISLPEAKDLALKRLQLVAEAKVFSVFDFLHNPLNVFANHEMAGMVDGNLSTKLTVQLNLFGGTVITLGSERHLEVARGIDSLKNVGCFCLTELGFGNNAVEMQTTATYDENKKEFVIHSPTVLSQKYWITNGALHSNYAVVFAQLIHRGNNEGVHAFLVQIRNPDKSVREGVFIEDMGHKLGLNGLDNARISFSHVRVPQTAILNKYSDIDESGNFKSSIAKRRDRFLRVADRLLSGRLCISSMCVSGTKLVLAICFRYASKRLAVGPDGKSNTPIMNFQLFQNALYPLLARTIILNLAFNQIKDIYANFVTKEPSNEVIRLCCAIKPLMSWNFREVAGVSVERCGGQGFLSANKLIEGIGGGHSGMVAEGDNSVLMQKVTKELMTDFQTGNYTPPQPTKKLGESLEIDSLIDLLRFRETELINEIASVTQQKMMDGKSIYDIWMREENGLIQDLAHAFGERIVAEFADITLRKCDENIFGIVKLMLTTHLLCAINKNLSWFLIKKAISKEMAGNLLVKMREMIASIHGIALQVVESFGIPEASFNAPIAKDYVDFNSRPNKGEVYNSKL